LRVRRGVKDFPALDGQQIRLYPNTREYNNTPEYKNIIKKFSHEFGTGWVTEAKRQPATTIDLHPPANENDYDGPVGYWEVVITIPSSLVGGREFSYRRSAQTPEELFGKAKRLIMDACQYIETA
jgi:hypothetical protein